MEDQATRLLSQGCCHKAEGDSTRAQTGGGLGAEERFVTGGLAALRRQMGADGGVREVAPAKGKGPWEWMGPCAAVVSAAGSGPSGSHPTPQGRSSSPEHACSIDLDHMVYGMEYGVIPATWPCSPCAILHPGSWHWVRLTSVLLHCRTASLLSFCTATS